MESKKKKTMEEDAPITLSAEEQEILKQVQEGKLEIEKGDRKFTSDSKYKYYHDEMYDVDPKLGLIYKDYDLISTQRTLVFTLIKQIGSNILKGKSIMNISLPVTITEPYSLLDRVASLYGFAPSMLQPLVDIVDPMERMKRIMSWAVASMTIGLSQRKPFNPIWGETLQGKIGHLDVLVEQTSHHPPIPNLLIEGKNLRIYGTHQIVAHTYPNSARATTYGKRIIEISGAHPGKYTLTHPEGEITGVMMGKRDFRYIGDIVIKDKTNKLYGQIRINPCKPGFFSSLFSSATYRHDHLKGFITKNKKLLKDTKEEVFKSKEILSSCEGNWIEKFEFDGKVYWELNLHKVEPVIRYSHRLLSDSSYRADLQALQKGNEKESQRLKEIMENVQRNDRKLREQARKKK